jgi:hypothetical protein
MSVTVRVPEELATFVHLVATGELKVVDSNL